MAVFLNVEVLFQKMRVTEIFHLTEVLAMSLKVAILEAFHKTLEVFLKIQEISHNKVDSDLLNFLVDFKYN